MKSIRQMKSWSRAALLGAVAATALLAVPSMERADAQSQNDTDTYRQLSLFGDVFERVRAEYVEEVSDQELIEAAINGMLVSLDPHSSFLNSKSFRDMRVQTKGEFGGLGIEVSMENGLVKVVSPIDDTPAAKAGLQPGDLITHLDGEPVLGLTLGQAVEKMRGPVDSDLTISIRRQDAEPFDVTLTRAVIKIRSVRSRVIDDVGYVRITTFNEQTTSGLHKAIEEIKAEKGDELTGYVIDLRNNPGGLLDEAISVSDTFLEQGEIVSTRGRDPENASRVHAKPGDLTDGKPLVVLINGGSASASEIVAGALQDHRRAILLGSQSFGKGSVQTIIPLSGQVAMRLTTARYYTPSGRSIQQTGIAPDIDVPLARIEKLDNGKSRREADLRGALNNPSGNGDNQTSAEDGEEAAAQPPEQVDYQLARAIDLLRGIDLYRQRIVN
ncbi:S41 family peptidase [Nisaea acidiphila]|uniref:S41 family peptidase n=1 Tax=Nisaea acidiphila TaxID=1862145 RepID=A0A9J7AY86_9PROT|nr:S41 family peptidase [Nisaea acidiphila]